MSELAYNLQGDRFTPPADAAAWRVRRLKPGGRGTPDVVFSDDGAPLMLPIDTELADFRAAVGHEPGRYRLDPVSDDHRPCDGGQPAYLQLAERDHLVDASVDVGHGSSVADDLLRELVQANTEMVRNIADKFASVMDSAATLIRAADGAGIPARLPVIAEVPAAELEDEDDDDPRNAPGSELTSLLSQVMPLVQMALAQKFGNKNDAPRNAAPDDDAEETGEDDGAPDSETCATEPEPEPEPMTVEQMAHVAAVQTKLTPQEAQLAQAVARELSPREVSAWLNQLCALSVDDAAALIRKTIAANDASTKEGATS